MRHYTLFYSWQADNQEVKNSIRKSIDFSVKELNKRGICIHVDQDTRDRIGTTSINDEVLNKIRESDIFLADLTPVTEYESDGVTKLVPNSNVIFEYGYAKGTIGMSRCILVAKLTNKQSIAQFPFDINHDSISIIKEASGLSNLSNWILKIAEDVDKCRDAQMQKYHCKLLFDNFDTSTQVIPVFKRSFYGLVKTDDAHQQVYLKDGWSHREVPMFKMSKNGVLVSPVSEIINKSLSRVSLWFINDGEEALENCELTIMPIEDGVRFEDCDFKSAFSNLHMVRSLNDPFSLSKRCVQEALKDVNPNASKEIDSFFLYVPANLSHVQLSWKMTSKHYSQEGILSINVHAQFKDSYEESDEQKIIIEDYIVSK